MKPDELLDEHRGPQRVDVWLVDERNTGAARDELQHVPDWSKTKASGKNPLIDQCLYQHGWSQAKASGKNPLIDQYLYQKAPARIHLGLFTARRMSRYVKRFVPQGW